jgi:hypothetical protein
MQRSIDAIRHGDQVIGTERLTASVTVELVATGTEHFAACGIRTRADFEQCVAAVFVVIDREALEQGIAGGAGSRGEFRSHGDIIAKRLAIVKLLALKLAKR